MSSYNRCSVSPLRLNRITTVAKNRHRGLTVVLEDVHDPHNAAAVLRSCDAFGVQDVYFVFNKQEEYNPKKVGKQSSSSAHKWLTYHMFQSIEDCYAELHEKGFETWAAVLRPNSTSIYDAHFADPDKKIALVFGNEHAGLSEEATQQADYTLYIPMRGMIESLNISVSVGVCLYAVTAQRVASRLNFLLS